MSQQTKAVQELMVDADYLATMQIRLKEGRNFSDIISADLTDAVLVNETLVKELGWTQALGKKMFSVNNRDGQPKIVVGVLMIFIPIPFSIKWNHSFSFCHPTQKNRIISTCVWPKEKRPEAMAYLEQTYKRFDPGNSAEYHFLDQNFAHQYASEQRQGNLSPVVYCACNDTFPGRFVRPC